MRACDHWTPQITMAWPGPLKLIWYSSVCGCLHGFLVLLQVHPILLFAVCPLHCSTSIEPTSHEAHSTEFKHSTATNGLKYINFHIPHTKTKDAGKDINIMDSTCAHAVLPLLLNTTYLPTRLSLSLLLSSHWRQQMASGLPWNIHDSWPNVMLFGRKTD